MAGKKRLLNIIILGLILFLASNVVRSYFKVQNRGKIIREAEKELTNLQDQNENLKRQLARAESWEYVEQEARGRLNLGKGNEVSIILPTIVIETTPTPTLRDQSPNWEKWVKVFVK